MNPFFVVLDSPVVALVGADARRFCNSMFTNNARDLPVGQAQRTAMLDDRGRVQGLLDLYCESDGRLLAVLDGVGADAFGERYAMYVVLDDVEIVPEPELAVGTIQGAQTGPLPAGFLTLSRDRSGVGGHDIVGPRAELRSWGERLGLREPAAGELEWLRVRAGSPAWPQDFGPKRLAHEMNLREHFLHFEKGCYVGQETVNRVDVMGQVKRRLCALGLGDGTPNGAELHADGKAVGTLTTVVDDPGLGRTGLAVLRLPCDAPGTALRCVWDGGEAEATVLNLPMTAP